MAPSGAGHQRDRGRECAQLRAVWASLVSVQLWTQLLKNTRTLCLPGLYTVSTSLETRPLPLLHTELKSHLSPVLPEP